MNKKVSLIIPAYNTDKYLDDCLSSAINQTLKEIEIICINDGSTDNSLKILQSYAKKDNRIVIINQNNQGLSASRNNALKIAKGEYISFLDSDDTLELNALNKVYTHAKNTNSDIVVTQSKRINDNGEIIVSSFPKLALNHFDNVVNPNFPVSVCTKLFLKNLFIKNNIIFPIGNNYEDHITSIKLFFHARKVEYLKDTFYNYHIRENSITTTLDKKKIDDIFQVAVDMKEFFYSNNLIKYDKNIYFKIIKLSIAYILPKLKDKVLIEYFIKKFISSNIFKEEFILELKDEYYGLYIDFLLKCINFKIKFDITRFDLILCKYPVTEVSKLESIIKQNEEINFSKLFMSYLIEHKIHEIIIYGIGKGFLDLLPFLQKNDIQVKAIMDKNLNNFKQEYNNFTKISFDKYNKIIENQSILVTSIAFVSEIRNDLLSYSNKYNIPFNIIDIRTILENE